mgnify:CR=1 FL=1
MLLSAFAGYQIRTGRQADGSTRFMDVPILYGGMERTVSYLLRGGNDNVINYVPMASLYMTGLRQNPDRRHNPTHVEPVDWIEPMRTEDGRIIANQPGRKITVDRPMPVPWTMDFEVSFWCSNEDQGFQMIEQIGTVYNPGCDLLVSNGPADWTKLTTIIFTGDLKIERVTPDTSADPLYVYTFPFTIDFWLSLPVKLYDSKLIYEVHVPIGEIEENFSFDSMDEISDVVIKADPTDVLNFESIQWKP